MRGCLAPSRRPRPRASRPLSPPYSHITLNKLSKRARQPQEHGYARMPDFFYAFLPHQLPLEPHPRHTSVPTPLWPPPDHFALHLGSVSTLSAFALVLPLVRVPALPTAVLAMHQGALLDGRTNGAVFVGLPQFGSVLLFYASVRTAPHLASF
jgi:hypothetical protein